MMIFGCSARRGRIYLPQDELAQAGLSEEDIFAGKVTDKWRNFMKKQIKRARKFFVDAENGVKELSAASRWPVSILSSEIFCCRKESCLKVRGGCRCGRRCFCTSRYSTR